MSDGGVGSGGDMGGLGIAVGTETGIPGEIGFAPTVIGLTVGSGEIESPRKWEEKLEEKKEGKEEAKAAKEAEKIRKKRRRPSLLEAEEGLISSSPSFYRSLLR